jgi:hypothetical protein
MGQWYAETPDGTFEPISDEEFRRRHLAAIEWDRAGRPGLTPKPDINDTPIKAGKYVRCVQGKLFTEEGEA